MPKSQPKSRLTVDALTKRGASKEVMLLVPAKVRRIGRDVAGTMVSKALLTDLCEALTSVAVPLWASGQGGIDSVDFLVVGIFPGDAEGMVGASLWLLPKDGKAPSKQAVRAVHEGLTAALMFVVGRTYAATEDMFAPSVNAPDWLLAGEAWHRSLGSMSRAARRAKQSLHLICTNGPAEMLAPVPIPPSQPELMRQIEIYGVVDTFKRSRAWMQIQGHEGDVSTSLAAQQRTFSLNFLHAKDKIVAMALVDGKPRAWQANIMRIVKDGYREVLKFVLV